MRRLSELDECGSQAKLLQLLEAIEEMRGIVLYRNSFSERTCRIEIMWAYGEFVIECSGRCGRGQVHGFERLLIRLELEFQASG